MRLPNAERAVVEPAKIEDYLLSRTHPVGRFKATFFGALGYEATEWSALRDDLLELARTEDAEPGQTSQFGAKYLVSGTLTGPSGRSAAVTTVWIVLAGQAAPRFVTAYPS